MYNNEDNEKDYGINWIGLFIKVIIFVMFILLAVWLVTKVFFSYSNKDLENDLSRMKIAAENYFTEDNLPQEVGKSKILTLNEMLSQKLVKSKTIDSCDKEQSYAKATKYEEYALIKVELVCGNKKDTTTTKIDRNGNKTTVDDNKTTETKEEKKTDNSTKVLFIKIPLQMIAKRTIVLNQIKKHHQVKIPNQIQVQVETKNQIVQAVMRQIMLQPE